jgi:hypothetical protein
VLGWREARRRPTAFRRREYAVDFAVNSHASGIPSAAPGAAGDGADPRPGRLLVEGYGVPRAEPVTQVLEALRGRGCPVQVVNGDHRYSTDQYLFRTEESARARGRGPILYYNDIPNERQL